MSNSIDKNALMQAVQCVSAMQRFIEEYIAKLDNSDKEGSVLSELSADLYNALDILSNAYEETRRDGDGSPGVEALQDAFTRYTMVLKEI